MNTYTVRQLSRAAGVPVRCIGQWIRRGDLKAVKDEKGWWRLDPVDAMADIQILRAKRRPRSDLGVERH